MCHVASEFQPCVTNTLVNAPIRCTYLSAAFWQNVTKRDNHQMTRSTQYVSAAVSSAWTDDNMIACRPSGPALGGATIPGDWHRLTDRPQQTDRLETIDKLMKSNTINRTAPLANDWSTFHTIKLHYTRPTVLMTSLKTCHFMQCVVYVSLSDKARLHSVALTNMPSTSLAYTPSRPVAPPPPSALPSFFGITIFTNLNDNLDLTLIQNKLQWPSVCLH